MTVVRPEDLGESEIDAWHCMQRATPALANPFLSPEFSTVTAPFRPAARVALLTDAGSILGFFPFEKYRFGVGGPICGWLTPCQGLIHAPGVEWDPRELLRGCGLAAWQFDHLAAGQKPFLGYQDATVAAPVIDLVGGFGAFQARLREKSVKFCRELERKERKLARDAGKLHFAADSTDLAVLRTLMTWKSEQYRRTGLTDRFAFPWVVDVLDALLATRSDHVSGLLCGLYADDQLIAGQFGLRSGKFFAGWITGYDPAFAKYTPGLIQTIRLVEALAATGVQTIDMGKGANAYKDSLKSRDNFVAEGIVTRVSVLAAAHQVRRTAARFATRILNKHPSLYRATRPVRTALRRYVSPPAPDERRSLPADSPPLDECSAGMSQIGAGPQ